MIHTYFNYLSELCLLFGVAINLVSLSQLLKPVSASTHFCLSNEPRQNNLLKGMVSLKPYVEVF